MQSRYGRIGGLIINDPILQLAEKTALKSPMLQKMSAIIFRGDEVINTGFNRWLYIGRRQIKSRTGTPYSIHAEQDALEDCSRKELRNASIYIHRAGSKLARPCNCCMARILRSGIREDRVYWSGI
jgi:deoxycytidylate deaminase